MRIVDVTLPVVGGLEPTTLRFDPELSVVDTDRITLAQLRTSFEALFEGRLDARWTVHLDGVERPATRALAERIGRAPAAVRSIRSLATRPSAADRLELLALRTGLELRGRLDERCTPELVANGLVETENRERRYRADLDRRLNEAEYRRNQRAAELEESRDLTPEERSRRRALLQDAERELQTLRERSGTPEPRNLCAAYVFSLHQSRGGRAGLLVGDLERLDRSLAVLADGRDPLDALTDAGFGPVDEQLDELATEHRDADPEIGPVPLVLEPILAGTDPTLAAHALRSARPIADGPQVIVLGPTPAATALRSRFSA